MTVRASTEKAANLIARLVGSMWMLYASISGFKIWMAGLGVTVAGRSLSVQPHAARGRGIMQWLAMIAILVAENAQGERQDKQVEHLHQLGVTPHSVVVENTELTEAVHEYLIKAPRGVRFTNGGHGGDVKP